MLEKIQKRLDSNATGQAHCVALKVTNRNQQGCEGVILWMHLNEHGLDGWEYIVHHFFALNREDQAVFETGSYYFNSTEAQEKYEERVRKGY